MPREDTFTRAEIDAAIKATDEEIRQANRIIALRSQSRVVADELTALESRLLIAGRNEFLAFTAWATGGDMKPWAEAKATYFTIYEERALLSGRYHEITKLMNADFASLDDDLMNGLKQRSDYLTNLEAVDDPSQCRILGLSPEASETVNATGHRDGISV